MATTTKKAPAKKLTVDDYKKLLGDEKKEVVVELPISSLTGSLESFVKKVNKAVQDSEIEGKYTLKFADEVYASYRGYGYSRTRTGGKPKRITITGSRPYTDAEYEVLGAKLVATKVARDAREAKKRAANLAKYNALAEKLGFEPADA